jgi:hypothetical protein
LIWGDVAAQSHFANKKELCETTESKQKTTNAPNKWVKKIANVIGDYEGCILTTDVYKILGLDRDPGLRGHESILHIGNAMRHLGWRRKRRRNGHHLRWFYVKGDKNKDIFVLRDPLTGKLLVSNSPSFTDRHTHQQ